MNKYKLFIPIGETLELDNGKTITCVEDDHLCRRRTV